MARRGGYIFDTAGFKPVTSKDPASRIEQRAPRRRGLPLVLIPTFRGVYRTRHAHNTFIIYMHVCI